MNETWNRYSRQMLFEPVGESGQQSLADKKVLIVGMGALGTVVANHLARAGTGHLVFADRDYVEESNLQRQMLFLESDAAEMKPKAEAALERLKQINSAVKYTAHVTDVTRENILELMEGCDLVLDGTDNFETRFLINDAAFKLGVPYIYGGAVSARGMQASFIPGKTPCLRCMVEPGASGGQTCDTAGVLSMAVDQAASFQATEALKLLTGNEEAVRSTLLTFDVWGSSRFEMKLKKRDGCPTCVEKEFPFLNSSEGDNRAVTLCGRETVQIQGSGKRDLSEWNDRLAKVGTVKKTPFLLRADVEEGIRLVLFPDGRTLVQGTEDVTRARSVYAKYVGS
ncbi:ThiF family adenylyltransferase [Alteribacter natronophilus]|uniref:ThiF family adenylyltransferase n=1 Tax=Alteribacter natronophilus TaxID=2583810 RepID=UPI00110F5B8B|nr:ThiF family adenylyltransferase [Alteribacter natronophilus]TMW73802.1 thiazole biosynthesis adenylyltransferase ThiF [Alteribacter natronophilus]